MPLGRDRRAVRVHLAPFEPQIEGCMERNEPSVSDAFGGQPTATPGVVHRLSATTAWQDRQWDRCSPAQRGFVAFSGQMREGTMMVTPSNRPGSLHIDLQFADAAHAYTALSAVVREGWLRDVAMAERGEWSYGRLVDALLEVAALPNQRTVRMECQRLSA